jgi:hypothetical protein
VAERPCQAPRKDGSACRARPLPDSALCWSHDPTRAEAAREARSKGARKANTLRLLRGRRRRLEHAGRLATFLSDLIEDVLIGTVAADIARTCFYGASVLRQVVETSDLERRLAVLEQQAATQQPNGRRAWRA